MQKPIPYYSADGTFRGFRAPAAALRLVQNGLVTGAYGRKGHLRAIYARKEDGSCSVDQQPPIGTRYIFREHLDSGHIAWAMKQLGKRDELRDLFLQVVTDCLLDP